LVIEWLDVAWRGGLHATIHSLLERHVGVRIPEAAFSTPRIAFTITVPPLARVSQTSCSPAAPPGEFCNPSTWFTPSRPAWLPILSMRRHRNGQSNLAQTGSAAKPKVRQPVPQKQQIMLRLEKRC
jgi:hypothetical protein